VGAVGAGAHRLELCRDLEAGGLTPPSELLAEVRAAVGVPVFAMARPRPGAFVLEADAAALLVADVIRMAESGADGVVMGALLRDGTIDTATTRRCVEAAGPLPVTFHRAFDEVADPLAALDTLVDVGVRRVLTAGGPGRARDGADRLAALVRYAAGRIVILAGGGVRGDHVRHLVAFTGVHEVHARASAIAGLSRALAVG
jgi:copper homeostasis protein